jgi:UDP-sulfoquinovose synthase
VTNPAEQGEFRVFNQFTESFSIRELADKVAEEFPGKVEIATGTPNPRVEKEEHYYRAAHTKLLDLGLVPHLLSRSTIASILSVVERNRDRIDMAAIAPTVNWRNTSAGTPVSDDARVGSRRS